MKRRDESRKVYLLHIQAKQLLIRAVTLGRKDAEMKIRVLHNPERNRFKASRFLGITVSLSVNVFHANKE